MSQQWFMFYQAVPESEWLVSLASRREALIAEGVPFVSVLDVDHPFDTALGPEERAKVRYKGPAYFDFDAESIEDAIKDVQRFVLELQDKDVDPECLEIYVTGGRGFHIEIPMGVLLDRPKPQGIPLQPLINREIAFQFQQDSLDLRIYSMGRGRMWRNVNVKRPNGRYKVPITYDELQAMTPEMYETVSSSPRMPIPRKAPKLAGPLATLWAAAHHRIDTQPKRSPRKDQRVLESLGGEWSKSMRGLLDGSTVEQGIGFQKIATQLAITAHALGKTLEQFLEDAQQLCQNYQGDSTRYGTYQKRVNELSRMYHYMSEHPAYTFSVGGLKSLMVPGTKTPELNALEVTDGEAQMATERADGEYSVVCNRYGIFVRNRESGELDVRGDIGFMFPLGIYSYDGQDAAEMTHIRAEMHREGVMWKSQAMISTDVFTSRATLLRFIKGAPGIHELTDIQVTKLYKYLGDLVVQQNNKVFTLHREGLNIVRIPADPRNPDSEVNDVVWASTMGGCYSRTEDESVPESARKFEIRTTGFGVATSFNSDLMAAKRWTVDFNSPEEKVLLRTYMTHLLNINSPHVVGAFVGWFTAAHFTPFVREAFNGAFSFLHPYGEAGSGKSQTALLFSRLHYHKADAPLLALGSGTTKFAMESRWTASSSIPLVFDEYKPRTMRQSLLNDFKALARSAYQANQTTKGGIGRGRDGNGDSMIVQKEMLTAPMVYIAEAHETETAMEERSVAVPMAKVYRGGGKLVSEGKSSQEMAFDYVSDYERACQYLGALGKFLALTAQRTATADVRSEIQEMVRIIKEENPNLAGDDSRRILGMAIVRWGVRQFWYALNHNLKVEECPEFYERLQQCENACTLNDYAGGEVDDGLSLSPRSELTKVLDTIAFLSVLGEDRPERVVEGTDYFVADEDFVDLHLRLSFDKYQRYCRASDNEAYFEGYAAFAQAVRSYGGLAGKAPPTSLLVINHSTHDPILRFKRKVMNKDGITQFRTKG